MSALFSVLMLTSLVAFIIGMIKPSIVKVKSRKIASLIFGGGTIVFFILIGAAIPSSPKEQIQSNQTLSGETNNTATISQSTSSQDSNNTTVAAQTVPKTDQEKLEDSLKSNIPKSIGGTDFSYKGLEVQKADPDRPAGTKMITVSVELGSFLDKASLLRDTGQLSSRLLQTVFQSNINAYDVIVWYYGQTTDKYGNKDDSIVLTYAMGKDTYAKINWQNFNQAGLCDFFNQELRLGNTGTNCNILADIQ